MDMGDMTEMMGDMGEMMDMIHDPLATCLLDSLENLMLERLITHLLLADIINT